MTDLSFQTIFQALENAQLPDCRLVVGIADGGTIPAALVAARIGRDLKIVKFNYRNAENIPQHTEPVLLSPTKLPEDSESILLVDDVSMSGKTLKAAKKLFNGQKIATMVFKGQADFVLFPEISDCVKWPWKI